MRFFFIFILLIPSWAWSLCADPCNCTADSVDAGTYNCASLTLNDITVNTVGANALIYNVTGNVTISGFLNLNGGNGGNGPAAGADTIAGTAGPGGFAGGGFTATVPEPGVSGEAGTEGTEGDNSFSNGGGVGFEVLGASGGGGNFGEPDVATNGQDAIANAPGNGETLGLKGSKGNPTTVLIQSTFSAATIRGGAGGGAGGAGDAGFGAFDSPGAGGGGGGALFIDADGTIDILAGSSVSADGGAGGDGFNYGGGGGGGAGGAIWLRAGGAMTIDGNVTASGGNGGTSTNNIGAVFAVGGDGGNGRIRLEDSDGVIGGAYVPPPYVTTGSSSSGSSSEVKFTSAISCGVISDKDHPSNLYQILFGFLIGISFLLIKKKSPTKS